MPEFEIIEVPQKYTSVSPVEPSNTTTKRPQMIIEPFTSLISFNYRSTPQLYIGYPPKGQYKLTFILRDGSNLSQEFIINVI